MNIALQIIAFLITNRKECVDLVMSIEQLAEKAAGPEKAAAFRGFVGAALGIEAQMEAAWPIVLPIFNLFVASVKKAA